jgi:calcineurin-like phosphoesterase family protein
MVGTVHIYVHYMKQSDAKKRISARMSELLEAKNACVHGGHGECAIEARPGKKKQGAKE